jgi:hypothetical protein
LDPQTIARALLVFLSSPVKPGATHRLTPGSEFEARLVEAQVASRFIEEAYQRGSMLARGEVDSEGVGLGRLIQGSLVKSFEATGEEPLVGLHVAAIVVSAAAGYLQGASLSSSISRDLSALLYTRTSESSEALLEALEAVGASDMVSRLYDKGITRGQIRAYAIDLGTVFEELSSVDTGFWLNLASYKRVLQVASSVRGRKTVAEASVAAYLSLLSMLGVKVKAGGVRELLDADRSLRRRGFKGDRALGAAFAAVVVALDGEGVERLV